MKEPYLEKIIHYGLNLREDKTYFVAKTHLLIASHTSILIVNKLLLVLLTEVSLSN